MIYAVHHPEDDRPVFVKRGETGFWEPQQPSHMQQWNDFRALQTHYESEAALAGSVFGWDCDEASSAKEYDRAFHVEVDGQRMLVKYRKAFFGEGSDYATDHFEFHSPHHPPRRIPVSTTGYRSHFVNSGIVAAYGDVEAFAREEVFAIMGITPQKDTAQGGLFS